MGQMIDNIEAVARPREVLFLLLKKLKTRNCCSMGSILSLTAVLIALAILHPIVLCSAVMSDSPRGEVCVLAEIKPERLGHKHLLLNDVCLDQVSRMTRSSSYCTYSGAASIYTFQYIHSEICAGR